MDAFFELHSGLPREGPGSDQATREAIQRLRAGQGSDWQPQRVIDIGCGPGRQTVVLARELNVPIIAIDFHEPYLEQLQQAARAAGLEHLVKPLRAGMESLDVPPGSVDLIWAEGSIYIIGFATGLSLWRRLLADGGTVVASELTWLNDHPPAEVRDYWQQGYPPMTNIQGNIANAGAVGYEVFDHFVLERRAWWDEYYIPLERRAGEIRCGEVGPEMKLVLEENDREIDIARRYGDHFSYVFYLMRKVDVPDQKGCMHEAS